ncbi:MAG TPA: glycosyltransferase family 4 protein [Candidatus Acidoferrales bacterium]
MTEKKYRLLILATHPVQYVSPLIRLMARNAKLDVLVAYLSLRGARPYADRGFGIEISWDIPLLEGYPWIELGKKDQSGKKTRGWGLIRLYREIWNLVRNGKFDVLYVSGYNFPEAWAALLSAKCHGTAIIFHTDAHLMRTPNTHSPLRLLVKRLALQRVFALAAGVLVSSTGGFEYVKSLGVAEDRIFLAGSVVDNDWWTEQSAQVDRGEVRRSWNIPADASVVLFCAKLQSLKRPGDLVEAFWRAKVANSYLVFAGDGHLRAALEQQVQDLGIAERVRFLGFVNQSGLPRVYVASDLLVLPSEYESFGVVMNEGMICGCAVIVSDRVGGKYDLVREGETGYIFPCGEVDALADILRKLLDDPAKLKRMGAAAVERMKSWTPQHNIQMWVAAVDKAVGPLKDRT